MNSVFLKLLEAEASKGEKIRTRQTFPASLRGNGVGFASLAAGSLFIFTSEAEIVAEEDPALPRLTVVPYTSLNTSGNLIQNGDFSSFTFGDFDEFGQVVPSGPSGTFLQFPFWELIASPEDSEPGWLAVGSSPSEYLYAGSGALGNQIISASESPVFNANGTLQNLVTITTEYQLGGQQSISTVLSQTYQLQFDARPAFGARAERELVDGIFLLEVTGYSPMFLRVDTVDTVSYQLQFDALSENTMIRFSDLGYAERGYYAKTDTLNWDLPESSLSQVAGWDNVAVVAVPEPSAVAFLLMGAAMLFAMARKRLR